MRHILNMGTLLGMVGILVAGGCATTGSGASDDELIGTLLGQWKQAILSEDAEGLLAKYSEDFAHDGIQGDRYKDAEINIEDVDITIEGGVATVYPIEFSNWEGRVTIELTLARETAGWLITDMQVDGM